MKNTDKITVYYFGSANSTVYRSKVVTVKTFKKWWAEGKKQAKDIAFILKGSHKDIQSYEYNSYVEEGDFKVSLMKVLKSE